MSQGATTDGLLAARRTCRALIGSTRLLHGSFARLKTAPTTAHCWQIVREGGSSGRGREHRRTDPIGRLL